MNLNELDNLDTDSDSGHSVDPNTDPLRNQQKSREALSLPSVPFDPEWVSPFTLPPLPALRKNRRQSNLLRSPEERLHERSTSSAYYAAAWGSPYATPSPNRSPRLRSARRSQDLETASPLSSRLTEYTPDIASLKKSIRTSGLKPDSNLSSRKRASSWDRQTSLSERFNWLSESDLSESEVNIRAERTPTRDTYLKSLKASVDSVRLPRSRTHQVRESTATITPETFNAEDNIITTESHNTEAAEAMEPSTGSPQKGLSSGNDIEKPLPNLPSLSIIEKRAEIAPTTASPDSPSRPRIQSVQSFQRPKRKVQWKGKTCIIALPLDDRESAGLPPLLNSEEIKKRMQKWVSKGYDIDNLLAGGPQDTSVGFGQSRSVFPDPADMYAERKNSTLHVHVPDQNEWNAWVEYLREERLRALGVTPSNSEPPMSVHSPFSSTLSRVSSTYPSIAASPPIGSVSANGNPIRIASNTFSPPLGHQGMNSRGGSHAASPSISGYPVSMHGYKPSIAHQRLTSPYDYPVSHPGSYVPGMRNTSGGYGMRQFSPPTVANLQSLGQVLSPMIPTIPSNDNGRGVAQNPTMEQIRQQQHRQQQLHQHMMNQHSRQMSYFPPQSKSADNLPRTPILESPSRHTPEIVHPTPRSHRHNLSAALQKGVDDAEAARSDQDSGSTKNNVQQSLRDIVAEKPDDNAADDEQEPELPVLKRPETIADIDDKSEIETNPSIAASPLLMDTQNPFGAPLANLQQIKEALQPQAQHKAKPSMSKFNIDAPAFNPRGGFSSSNFNFAAPAFQPSTTVATNKSLVPGSRPSFPISNLSMSKLNVEAPAFTPSFVAHGTPTKDSTPVKITPVKPLDDTPSKSPFTFSSPSFNVDAPEFKPGQSFSFTANRNSSLQGQSSFTSAGSIFGNVTVDANSKVNRRGPKIVPIVRPQSSEGEEEEQVYDAAGRVAAPSDRQKRARRVGGDDDDELLFANSAPFNHADGLSAQKEPEQEAVDQPQETVPEDLIDLSADSSTEAPKAAETASGKEAEQDAPNPNSVSPEEPTIAEAEIQVLTASQPAEADELQVDAAEDLPSSSSTSPELEPELDNEPQVGGSVKENEKVSAIDLIDTPEDIKDIPIDTVNTDGTDNTSVFQTSESASAIADNQNASTNATAETADSDASVTPKPTIDTVLAPVADANIEPTDDKSHDSIGHVDSSVVPSDVAQETEEPSKVSDSTLIPVSESVEQQTKSIESSPKLGHASKFSLSALAKPFEFRPGAAQAFVPASSTISQTTPKLKQNQGLMASRYATASPEPEPEVITRVDGNESPPRDMYEYVGSEGVEAERAVSPDQPIATMTPALKMPDIKFEATPQLERSIEESFKSGPQRRTESDASSRRSMVDESMPSYEEIDAVMKQFENNPDLGVEREETPIKSTPLIDMRFPPVFRSDAPSPSPRRMATSPQRRADWGLGIHKLNDGNDVVSDWNEEFSPQQEDKLQSQATYFDSHVNHLVGGILENRLVPLEETLQTIQESLLTLMGKKSRASARRSMSTEKKDSDADDEDDYDAFEGFSSYRSRSPSRNQRKADKIKAIIVETMAAHQPPIQEQPILDMTEIHAALDEMRKLSQQNLQSSAKQPDTRAIMEELLSSHPSIQALKQQENHSTAKEKLRHEIDVLRVELKEAEKRAVEEMVIRQDNEKDLEVLKVSLKEAEKRAAEAMAVREQNERDQEILRVSLKEAEKRAVQEMAIHKQNDKEIEQLNIKLNEAQKEVDSHREALAEAQSNITGFEKERETHQNLKTDHADLAENNKALEETLEEYRMSSDQFRDDIKLERARNKDLIRTMHNLREEFNEKLESRQSLRSQMERLQDKMEQVMHDVHADEAEWRRKEHELIIQINTTQAALDHEVRHREKVELELDHLDREHKENMRYKAQHDHAQKQIADLQDRITRLHEDNKTHQDRAFEVERELAYIKDNTDADVSKATTKLESDLEAAQLNIESLKADHDVQLSRLQKKLDDAETDLEDQKAKHDTAISEAVGTHDQNLQEAIQKRDSALEEQRLAHEKYLDDLKEQHTRALHNTSEDRHRLEGQLNERFALSEDRNKHLESQIKGLEETLEITKSAARAAVEAATAKAASLPTPAPSVVASPPQRLSSASMQLIKGSDIPEKISPQAMRESIMVLQDQLQNREQTIEQLESEVASFDKEAPTKIKERDNEIALLQELLSVRVDDLNEIISTLSQSTFDREATKNAAIRLRANLQMEQQLKERAATSGGLTGSLPSISALTSFAPSPRGLPLAAAAAWGNWRKARDFSLNAVSDIATNISQTPSKSTAGSPSAFLAGIMTPPSAQRTPPPSDINPLSPPAMRPLAAAAAARKNNGIPSEARPLRTYSTQARTLSSRQTDKRRESSESESSVASKRHTKAQPETPTTPTVSRNTRNIDLEDDVDEDASPFNINDHTDRDAEISSKVAAAS